LFKVRVGIKTTADKVFISDSWNRLSKEIPENEILKDLISQENIQKWAIGDNLQLKVLYPHTVINGKRSTVDLRDFPMALKYLKGNEEILKARKYVIDAGREWFEIWVPQNPEYWSLPKLIFPDISPNPRFCFDKHGRIVNGNCYWIVALEDQEIDLLYLIEGIGNSKLMTKYHDLVFNNKLYSGRRRYFSQFVENYPIPNPDSASSKEIIKIVKKLNANTFPEEKEILEKQLEINVANSFGVEPVLNLD